MARLQIRKKTLLILLLSASQLACLLIATVFFGRWLTAQLNSTVQAQVLNDNKQIAQQLATLIRETGISSPRPPSSDWNRMQRIVEEIQLPNDGFVCVVDSKSGFLLCHPDFRRDTSLASTPVGKMSLECPTGSPKIVDAAASTDAVGGWVTFPDGRQVVGAKAIPELGVTVLAHQRIANIAAATARFVRPVQYVGYVVSLCLATITLALSTAIVRRYENRLAVINSHLELLVEKRSRSLMKTRDAVIFGLAKLAESRDDDTGEHLDRIKQYVEILGRRLRGEGLSESDIDRMVFASSLHDIGKVGIPDAVLCKPGALTAAERQEMQRHPVLGADCLDAIRNQLKGDDDFLATASEIARYHHEKWDGTGYPTGLAGDAIPLSARIVAVADVYDALTSKRVYKDALPHDKAVAIIVEGSGKHFDPMVVSVMLSQAKRFARVSGKSQNATTTELLRYQREGLPIGFLPAGRLG